MDSSASSAAALPWLDIGQLTYSFVPDGTAFGSETSLLFSKLSASGSSAEWQQAFDQAFHEWMTPLETTATRVEDSGLPFGSRGATQGDNRFGDIRIGAVPLSENVLAEAIPHAIITQGSWAGDILLNANADWGSLDRVMSVALHEIGHVLGLPHASDVNSPMNVASDSGSLAPTPNDILQLKRLYAGIKVESSDGHGGEMH